MNVLITTIRPSRKGNVGARMARMAKNPRNRDHGRLLQQCEKGRAVEGDPETDSYDLRDCLAAPRFSKRDRKTWKAGIKLVESLEPLAKSRSFIPPPS